MISSHRQESAVETLCSFFTQVAGVFALLGILTGPLTFKFCIGPTAVGCTDACLALSFLLFFPQILRHLRTKAFWLPLHAVCPLLGCASLSALSSDLLLPSLKEISQVVLYGFGGVLVYSHLFHSRSWRIAAVWSLCCALLADIVSLSGVLSPDRSTFPTAEAMSPPAGAYLLLSSFLLVAIAQSLRAQRLKRGMSVFAGLCAVILTAHLCFAGRAATPKQNTEGASIPQRYLEAYAALCVVADRPLFGVGLGAYQEHIGRYYQGMPKENTIVPGTQIGYAVLLASGGILCLASFLYWTVAIWRKAKHSREQTMIRLFLLVLWSAGFLTPLFVGHFLLPLVVAHAYTFSAGGNRD